MGARRDDGRVEPFYVVRFRQQDLWPRYTSLPSLDTLETEASERWLERRATVEGRRMRAPATTTTTSAPIETRQRRK